MKKLKHYFYKILYFIRKDIWRIRLKDLSKGKYYLIRILRIILLAFRGFSKDQIIVRAAALTYYSLLSIVPVIAMGFGIAKGFGLEKILISEMRSYFAGQEAIMEKSIEFAKSLLETTKGGLIAGIGMVVLLYTIMRLLNNIEDTFNNIWEVEKHRSFARKFSDYMSIMLFAPILIILSSTVTVFITTKIRNITQEVELLEFFSPVILFLLRFSPYFIIWILLTLVYLILPNTHVKFRSALIAGITAGTLYQLVQWVYISSQFGVSRYNAIYGSFAALPLFLIWLSLSWMIILMGAEVAYADQNVDSFEFKNELKISHRFKLLLSLKIVHLIIINFVNGKQPYTAKQLAEKMELPLRYIRFIIDELILSHIITEVKDINHKKQSAYQPALAIEHITISYVLEKIECRGIDNVRPEKSDEWLKFTNSLDDFKNLIRKSEANKLIKDI